MPPEGGLEGAWGRCPEGRGGAGRQGRIGTEERGNDDRTSAGFQRQHRGGVAVYAAMDTLMVGDWRAGQDPSEPPTALVLAGRRWERGGPAR